MTPQLELELDKINRLASARFTHLFTCLKRGLITEAEYEASCEKVNRWEIARETEVFRVHNIGDPEL